jgi:hypothetical protein
VPNRHTAKNRLMGAACFASQLQIAVHRLPLQRQHATSRDLSQRRTGERATRTNATATTSHHASTLLAPQLSDFELPHVHPGTAPAVSPDPGLRPPRCTIISAENSESRPSRCAIAPRAWTLLTVVPSAGSGHEGSEAGSPSLIDEIVRESARRMLAEALRAEVDAYAAAFWGAG